LEVHRKDLVFALLQFDDGIKGVAQNANDHEAKGARPSGVTH
jgi:hypothetical protein